QLEYEVNALKREIKTVDTNLEFNRKEIKKNQITLQYLKSSLNAFAMQRYGYFQKYKVLLEEILNTYESIKKLTFLMSQVHHVTAIVQKVCPTVNPSHVDLLFLGKFQSELVN